MPKIEGKSYRHVQRQIIFPVIIVLNAQQARLNEMQISLVLIMYRTLENTLHETILWQIALSITLEHAFWLAQALLDIMSCLFVVINLTCAYIFLWYWFFCWLSWCYFYDADSYIPIFSVLHIFWTIPGYMEDSINQHFPSSWLVFSKLNK